MPITYQRLGNSGGGMDLIVTTRPNVNVTLKNKSYEKTVTTNEQGRAEFKNLRDGNYIATLKNANEDVLYQKSITITRQRLETIGMYLGDLPLYSKIKFSSGKKFFLAGKGLKGRSPKWGYNGNHNPDSVTLMSEYVYDENKYGWARGVLYKDTEIFNTVLQTYYNELLDAEKECILEREVRCNIAPTMSASSKSEFLEKSYLVKSHFHLLANTELGDTHFNNTGDTEGALVMNCEYGTVKEPVKSIFGKPFFMRTMSYGAPQRNVVSENGTSVDMEIHDAPEGEKLGILPVCDLNRTAIVALDSDGYYRILGM